MNFRNDITPEDLGLIRGELPSYVIAYSESKKYEPFIVRVIDSDYLGWYRGILYEVNDRGKFLSEWPKTWYWAEWKDIRGSSNGRTAGSDPVDEGSTPSPRAWKHLEIDPGRCSGRLTLKNSRFTIHALLELIAKGYSIDSFLEEWNHYTKDQIVGAVLELANILRNKENIYEEDNGRS